MRRRSRKGLLLVVFTSLLLAFGGLVAAQVVLYPHWSGQPVAPVYEGYTRNPDGTFSMWYGYMNRNFEEEPDLPIGPENKFEPGPADRGQPTHFETRRHKDVFAVTVPADFGEKTELVWSLTLRGKTETVPGTLEPKWLIDRDHTTRTGNIESIISNLPPEVQIDPPEQTVGAGEPAAFKVSATDDGKPADRRTNKPVGLSIDWSKFRGPGAVTFDRQAGMLKDGKISTTARFSAPGEYVLLAVVDDGSGQNAGNFGYHCCWTDVQVKVTVR
jgi:hypothetical protein